MLRGYKETLMLHYPNATGDVIDISTAIIRVGIASQGGG